MMSLVHRLPAAMPLLIHTAEGERRITWGEFARAYDRLGVDALEAISDVIFTGDKCHDAIVNGPAMPGLRSVKIDIMAGREMEAMSDAELAEKEALFRWWGDAQAAAADALELLAANRTSKPC